MHYIKGITLKLAKKKQLLIVNLSLISLLSKDECNSPTQALTDRSVSHNLKNEATLGSIPLPIGENFICTFQEKIF